MPVRHFDETPAKMQAGELRSDTENESRHVVVSVVKVDGALPFEIAQLGACAIR